MDIIKPGGFVAYAVTFIVLGLAMRHVLGKRMSDILKETNNKLKQIMVTQETLVADLTILKGKITVIGEGIVALKEALATAGNLNPAAEAALTALKNEVDAAQSLLPTVGTTP